MAYKFVAGPYMNVLSQMASTPTCTPTADTSYPLEQAYDGIAAIPFRFESATSDSFIEFDLNRLVDPGFETSTTEWTGGALTQSSDNPRNGTYAALQSEDASYHDFVVKANQAMKIDWSAAMGTELGSFGAALQIEMLDLNQYLTSDSVWTPGSSNYVLTTTSTDWTDFTVSFSVPTSTELLQDSGTMRVSLVSLKEGETFGTAHFDDVSLYPAVSWVSVHGHNWTPAVTPEVLASTTTSSSDYSSISELNLYRDVALATFSTSYYRFWRFKLGGLPYAVPWLGELIFGQYEDLDLNPLYGSTIEYRERQVRKESPAGTVYVYNRGSEPVRTLKMTFYGNEAQYLQSRRQLFRAGRGGGNLMAIVATEMDQEQVILGRATESVPYVKTDGAFWGFGFDVVEDALPTISS